MSLKYVCEYVDLVVLCVLYEKLRIHVVMKSLRKSWNDKNCISVKACTQSIYGVEALTCCVIGLEYCTFKPLNLLLLNP
jgi:hypothetical protein